MTNFMKLFTNFYDYPLYSEISVITPKVIVPQWDNSGIGAYKAENEGILFEYVPSEFLDAYINRVNLIEGYALHRYSNPYETFVDAFYENHPKFHQYGDDSVFLAKTKNGLYYFFHYDFDVSDCSIGTFITSKTENEIISLFREHVEYMKKEVLHYTNSNGYNEEFENEIDAENHAKSYNPEKLDISRITGWKKWS